MALRAICLACTILVTAAGAWAERLPIRTYTNLDGLAHVRVTCIFSDSHGFVWFCGPDGLSRFDGQGFTRYDVRDGLGTALITAATQTSEGTYWVATNGEGIYKFTPQNLGPLAARDTSDRHPPATRFQKIPIGDSPRAQRVNIIYQDRAGNLWAGTDGGLFRFENEADSPAFQRVELGVAAPDESLQVWAITADHGGNLWIGTSWGLAGRLHDGRVVHSNVHPSQGTDNVTALLVDRQNRVWVGYDTGVVVFSPAGNPEAHGIAGVSGRRRTSRSLNLPMSGDPIWLTGDHGLSGGYVGSILQSSDGEIWIATFNGLTHFDGSRFRAFTHAHGVGRPNALAEDGDGNIWIGTHTTGAQRWARDGFRTYTESDGLADSVVRSVFENSAGQLHVISHNQRIHRFEGGRFTAVRPNLWADSTDMVRSGWALEDHNGEWWIPGGAGLYRFPRVKKLEDLAQVRPRLYTSRDGLAGEDAVRMFEDSRGDIWIGRRIPTQVVLTRWDRASDTFHKYGEVDGLPANNRIHSFAEDRSGNVWIGFRNGSVARWCRGRFMLFSSAQGAPAEWVHALHVDRRGRLWIGAQRPALTVVEDPAAERPLFVPYSRSQGLSGSSVTCITEDDRGYLYLCTIRGPIDRLEPESGEVRRFTAADGLIGADFEAAYRDRRGDLWFASYNGLQRLTPSADRPKRAPAVRIRSVRVAGESYLTSDLGVQEVHPFELRWNQNRLQIEFFALGAVPGTALRYEYMLEGADQSWNEPTDRRDVNYGGLSPGRYRFVVRALGVDGAASPEPATLAFTILGPFWQRWWFQSSVAAVIGLLALAAHRLRVRRLLGLQQVRMRIASDLHDDIGGSLSRIAIQSEVARREAARSGEEPARRLSDIAEGARDVVGALSDVVWAVDPRRDDLESVFRRLREYGGDVIRDSGARWTFSSAGKLAQVKLTPQARRHLFLLLKEALTNVARHAAAASVSMRVELANDALRVELLDDGRGFDTTPSEGEREPRRHGIGSMRARAESLRAHLEIESTCGSGTRLVLILRLPSRWRRMTMLLPPRMR